MSQPGGQGKLSIRAQMDIGDAEGKLKSLGSSIDSLGTKITGVATSINKLPQSLNSLKSAADSTTASITKLPTALNAIQTSTTSGIAGIDRLKTSVTGLGGTLNTAAGSVQQFSSRVQQSMQAISTGGGLTNVQTAVTGLNNTFNSGIPTIQRYSTTLTSLGTSASSGTSGMASLNNSMAQTASSANAASTSVGRSVQEYTALGGRLGGVALSAVIMTSAFDEAVGMQSALDASTKKVAAAQADYNKAVAESGMSSTEAERALARLEKAQNANQFATRNAGFAWRDMIPIGGLLATQAIEPMIKAFAKLNEMMKAGTLTSAFTGGLGKAGGGLSSLLGTLTGIEGGFQKGTQGAQGFTGALQSMNGAGAITGTTMGQMKGAFVALAAEMVIILAAFQAFQQVMKTIEVASATMSGKLVDAAEKTKEAWDMSKWTIAGGHVDILSRIFGTEEQLNKNIEGAKQLEGGVKLVKGEYEKFNDTIFITTAAHGRELQGVQLLKGEYKMVGDEVTVLKDVVAGITAEYDNNANSMLTLKQAQEDGRITAEEWVKVVRFEAEAGREAGQSAGFLTNEMGGLEVKTGVVTQFMDELTRALNDGADGMGTVAQKIEGGRGVIDSYVQSVTDLIASSETLSTAMQSENLEMEKNIEQTNELHENYVRLGEGSELYKNTVLGLQQSYADSVVAIDRLTVGLTDSEAIMTRHNTAVNQGHIAFLEWITTSQDASTAAQTFRSDLEGAANEIGNFPQHMQGTNEEIQAFITASNDGGEAAETFADMSLEAFRGLAAGAEPLFNDLKKGWADIFEGTTFDKAADAVATVNEKIRQNFEQQQEDIRGVNEKMWENITSNAEGGGKKVVDVMDGVKTTTVGLFDGVDWDALSAAMTDPFVEAFNKLPAAVSNTLDQTERATLTFQAKFAQVAEMAGTTFSTNLLSNMQFDNAIQIANQAVADMLAPFVAEHPEFAATLQPLFDAMNQVGPGSGQAVQEILERFAGIPGPIGDLSGQMLTAFQEKFAGKIPGVTKGGVEGAIQQLEISLVSMLSILGNQISESISTSMDKMVDSINDAINNNIKQDEDKIPLVTVNANPANTQIQSIATSLEQLKTYLDENRITLVAIEANPLEKQIQLIGEVIPQVKEFLAEEANMISLTASETNPLDAQVQLIGTSIAQVNQFLAEEANTISLVGSNVNPLAGQITLATQGPDLVQQFLDTNTITMVAANTNPLVGQINLVVAAPGQVNQNLTQNTITMVAANTNPLAGQITLTTQAPGQVNQNLQQNPISMVGANTNPLEAQVNLAVQAHQQLQQYFNQNPLTMPVQQPQQGYGTGMNPGGFNPGYVSPYGSYLGAYGAPGFAKGFGPRIVDKPTLMLVGEAGPELVSVQPEKGLKFSGNMPYVRAQEGYGDPYAGGGGMDYGAMEQAVQQGAQQGSMEGSQQGVEQGMQQGYQQAPSNTELFGAGRFGWSPSGGMGGGGAGQYPTAPSNTEMFGAGMQYWGGGRFGTQLGGGTAPTPQYPSASVPMGVNETIGFGSRPRYYTWTGGAMGTALTPSGPGLAPPPSQTQAQGQQTANDLTRGFQQGMAGQSQVWVNQGLKVGQTMGSATVMSFEDFMRSQQGRFNNMPNTVFRGFPAGAAVFGGLMGDAMMAAMGDVIAGSKGRVTEQLYDQWGNSYARMLEEFNRAAGGGGVGGGGTGGGRNLTPPPNQNLPAYTGSVPASYGRPLGQSINGVRATILPGGYVGSGQWPPTGPGGGAPTGGGGGGGLPPPQVIGRPGQSYGGSSGNPVQTLPPGWQPGQNPSAPGGPLSQPGGGVPERGGTVRGAWYGPNDPRNTVYAQGGFHGILNKAMSFVAHANERVDISPGPRGHINRDSIASAYKNEINDVVQAVKQMVQEKKSEGPQHFHIYIGNEKIKEIIHRTAGNQMDRFIR